MDLTPTRRDSTTSIESVSSNESTVSYQFISPETRVLNEAIAGWRDYHGNGRHIVGQRLLEIFMELTQRRAQMSVAEVEAFRMYPDFALMEAMLHHCLFLTWGEGPLPLLYHREVSYTPFNMVLMWFSFKIW